MSLEFLTLDSSEETARQVKALSRRNIARLAISARVILSDDRLDAISDPFNYEQILAMRGKLDTAQSGENDLHYTGAYENGRLVGFAKGDKTSLNLVNKFKKVNPLERIGTKFLHHELDPSYMTLDLTSDYALDLDENYQITAGLIEDQLSYARRNEQNRSFGFIAAPEEIALHALARNLKMRAVGTGKLDVIGDSTLQLDLTLYTTD